MQTIFFVLAIVLFQGLSNMENKNEVPEKDSFKSARINMVKNQIERRGIKDQRILNAMKEIPRHEFVPEKLQQQAYRDEPLPIGHNQTISQPYIVAYMTEQLMLNKDDKVLEIGTGSGYQAAVLAEICDSVYTIELIPELSEQAQTVLRNLGYKNIYFKIGDGYRGWAENGPFDAIIVTAAPDHVPPKLVEQLKIGGKMIIPVGDYLQELMLIIKQKSDVQKKIKIPVRFVPMRGEAEK